MFCVIYVSAAKAPMAREDLRRLLETSRANNQRRGITGMLVYKDGNFMQAIEGEEQEVRALQRTISADPRHHRVLELLATTIATRSFAEWTMGFRDLRDPELRSIPGYNEFLNTPLTGEEFAADPSIAQKLLLSFKQTM
jgi:hypothetical protein